MVSRTETVASLPQRTAAGRLYKDGTRKGILAFFGVGSDQHQWFTWDASTGEMRALTDGSGFPVAAMGTGTTWGNSTFRTNASQLKTNAQTALFASGKVHLLGASAGGLGALNWAKNNPTLVQSIVLLIPVLDVQYVHTNNIGGYAAAISTAYGGAPVDADNPADYAANLSGIPISLYYSTDDPYTPLSTNQAFIAATGAEGYSMGANQHGWTAPWSGANAGAFFSAHD